jgi:hypothetical protein
LEEQGGPKHYLPRTLQEYLFFYLEGGGACFSAKHGYLFTKLNLITPLFYKCEVRNCFRNNATYLPNYMGSHFTPVPKVRAMTSFERLIGLFTYQITKRQTPLPGG